MNESTDAAEAGAAGDAGDAGDAAPSSAAVADAPNDEPQESPEPQDDSDDSDDSEVVIGIRIREAARIYHFSAPRGQVFVGDYVVVDRARGDQLARVVTVPDDDAPPGRVSRDVRPIVRLADADDRARATAQGERADRILQEMRTAAVRDDLGLYPVAVELNLDGDLGTAWFQAPDHVDFRPLVEQIEEEFDVKLKMQQANQRERARLVDGYDICGLRLCCSSWMTDFPHVGIRVAKDQDLSLNPDSISGVCGRLLCCLTFEHEVYREMRGTLPRVGKRVSTPAGMGKVIKLNVLQQKVTIALDDHRQRVDVPADEIGLAVRTEDAPNQALVEAEREQREADRQAADLRNAAAPAVQADEADPSDSTSERPKRRRRRRSRKPKGDAVAAAQSDDAAPTEASRDELADGSRKRSSRRKRRRKAPVVGQAEASEASGDRGDQADGAAQVQPADGESRRSRRRRRRSRRPVNRPVDGEGPADSGGASD